MGMKACLMEGFARHSESSYSQYREFNQTHRRRNTADSSYEWKPNNHHKMKIIATIIILLRSYPPDIHPATSLSG